MKQKRNIIKNILSKMLKIKSKRCFSLPLLYRSSSLIVSILMLLCIVMPSFGEKETSLQSDEPIKLAILMYHGFTDKGKESEFVLKVSKLEKDIKYLRENGFTFIDTYDLIDFADKRLCLPQKCVMLTFDDGYLNNYLYAYPLLKKYKVKAVISPIAYFSDLYEKSDDHNPDYANMTWDIVEEMSKSNLIDFENHSYNLHTFGKGRNGSSRNRGEKIDDYMRFFYEDMKKAELSIEKVTKKDVLTYVYPFGCVSRESEYVLKMAQYRISMCCTEGYNTLYSGKKSYYMLKRFNRTPKISAKDILRNY